MNRQMTESSNMSFWPSVACKLSETDVWKMNGVKIFVKHLWKPSHWHVFCSDSGPSKVIAVGLLTVGGGIGGTILYAKWDNKFRAAVEKNVPYSDRLFGLALGPSPGVGSLPVLKKVRVKSLIIQQRFRNSQNTSQISWGSFFSRREEGASHGPLMMALFCSTLLCVRCQWVNQLPITSTCYNIIAMDTKQASWATTTVVCKIKVVYFKVKFCKI